jgi:hypothetical protein
MTRHHRGLIDGLLVLLALVFLGSGVFGIIAGCREYRESTEPPLVTRTEVLREHRK